MPGLERKDVENSEEEDEAGDENCGDQFLVHCKYITRPVTQVTDFKPDSLNNIRQSVDELLSTGTGVR